MNLAGKVVFVTGAGNGIGRQVALELTRRGAYVAGGDVSADGLAETARLAAAHGGTVTTHVLDVTDVDAVRKAHDDALDAHGHLDALVNVAGIIHRFAPVADLTVDEMRKVFEINYWGIVTTCQTFLPTLRTRPEAAILNVSSLSALIAFSGQTVYGASKGAVKQYSEGLYQELAGTPVRVTTVFPGNISTNISGNSGVAMLDSGGRKAPITTPEEAARRIVDGLERGSYRVIIGNDARALNLLTRLAPRRAADLITKQMRLVMKF